MPGAVEAEAESVIRLAPEPGAAMLAGEKLAVTPAGNGMAASMTAALKLLLPAVVTVAVPCWPSTIRNEVGRTVSA